MDETKNESKRSISKRTGSDLVGTIPSQTRLGSSLRSSRFDEELRSYLQRRLRLLTTTVSLLFLALSIKFIISLSADPGRNLVQAVVRFCTRFPNSVMFFLAASTTILALFLWRRTISPLLLSLVDALFLLSLIIPCLILYARLHFFSFPGFSAVVPFLMLFILARSILIPSEAWRTVLLSLPAPIGVLGLQLKAGASFISPGQPFESIHFTDTLMQNQVLLWGGVAVAAIASRVNLGLRRQNFTARHVGQYKVDGLLGSGGMGEVYQATHSLLKRPTALKFMRPDIAGVQTLARFEREVKQTSRLTHPNTISIFDYGHTVEGVFYYAMELLQGADLNQIVCSTGPLPPERAIAVLAQACGALSEAHGMGIVHRDIKPRNIMLCRLGGEYDRVKILDFGLVRDLNDLSSSSRDEGVSGTPETMAPEAQLPDGARPASDLYALCAVGYFLLTGKSVFSGPTIGEVLRAHREDLPVPPSRFLASIPGDLETILLQGLEKRPQDRPESAAVLRNRLLSCRKAGDWNQERAAAWWEANEGRISEQASSSTQTLDSPVEEGVNVTLTLDNL